MHQERNFTTVSLLLTQNRDLQNKANSLSDATEFYDPETASSSSSVLQETFLKAHLLEKDHPQLSSRIHGIRHHLLADYDQVKQEIFWNMEEGRDESRRVRQYQRHVLIKLSQPWTHYITLEELILTMVWWITWDLQSRKCIWENSRTHWNSKAGRSTSRLKYVQREQILISQCTGSKKLI